MYNVNNIQRKKERKREEESMHTINNIGINYCEY